MSAFELISDLHKDARGFRPSASYIEAFFAKTESEQQAQWDSLCAEFDRREMEEARQELAAQRKYEQRLASMQADYNIDRTTAIRWDLDGNDESLEEIDYALTHYGIADQEIDHFLWKQGIAFQLYPAYRAEFEVALGLDRAA